MNFEKAAKSDISFNFNKYLSFINLLRNLYIHTYIYILETKTNGDELCFKKLCLSLPKTSMDNNKYHNLSLSLLQISFLLL